MALEAILAQMRFLGVPLEIPLNVLDIGGGHGVLAKQIEESTAWIVDCADLNLDALNKSVSRRGRNLYYDVLEEDSSLINSYDIILFMDVLEHIANTEAFLKSVLAHLKSDGLLFLNVPAIQSLHSAYDTAMGHHRRYSKDTLRKEFRDLDFEIIDLRYWGLSLVSLLIIRNLMFALRKFENGEIIKFGFKVPNKTLNRIATTIGNIETTLFHSPFIGSSLLLAGKKK